MAPIGPGTPARNLANLATLCMEDSGSASAQYFEPHSLARETSPELLKQATYGRLRECFGFRKAGFAMGFIGNHWGPMEPMGLYGPMGTMGPWEPWTHEPMATDGRRAAGCRQPAADGRRRAAGGNQTQVRAKAAKTLTKTCSVEPSLRCYPHVYLCRICGITLIVPRTYWTWSKSVVSTAGLSNFCKKI